MIALLVFVGVTRADPVPLNAGGPVLSFPNGRGVAIGPYASDAPAVVVTDDGTVSTAGYDHVGSGDGLAVATATVVTPHGSRFAFADRWAVTSDGAFRLSRAVTVERADPRDHGFDTRFGLRVPSAKSVRDVELFAPGVWYGHNDHVVPNAIGADPNLPAYLIKETRLALPLVMVRPVAGPALTLLHADARPATPLRDASPDPQTDAGIQYGSIGPWTDADSLAVGFCFPGTEGAVAYRAPGWRYRYHPVRAGVGQRYDLIARLTDTPGFSAAMVGSWRHAVAAYAPDIRPAPSAALYRQGLAVFNKYYRDDFKDGGRGDPFMVWLGLHPPRGRDRGPRNPTAGRGVSDYHLQSGFVGQQIQAAYLGLRQATMDGDAARVTRWRSAVDFWVDRSLSPAGVPRTDYFCERGQWGDGPVFLRTIADGTEAVVDAHRIRPDPKWIAYARRVGDWLLANQAADGSWSRSYHPADGTVAHAGKFNTTNPLRLLVKLSAATGDMKYRDAAVRGGQWCLANIDGPSCFVGGTTDNDNTIDKEAGVLALYGFQALYDATGDGRWLAAAVRAADYAETWTYAWSYAAAANTGLAPGVRSPWPDCGLVGQSLVATGHSYADMFMAFCSTTYYRLAIQTGDDHYRQFARLLADGANRPADVSGALGYPDRGLIEEGVGPADFVAAGVGTCLTWCTVAQVRPVADLHDLFGVDTVDEAERTLTAEQRRVRNRPWYAGGKAEN